MPKKKLNNRCIPETQKELISAAAFKSSKYTVCLPVSSYHNIYFSDRDTHCIILKPSDRDYKREEANNFSF